MKKLGRVSRLTRGVVVIGMIEDLVDRPPGSRYPAV